MAITIYILGYAHTRPEISSEPNSVHSTVQKSFRWDNKWIMNKPRQPVRSRPSCQCQSLVDYGNTKISQLQEHAPKVSLSIFRMLIAWKKKSSLWVILSHIYIYIIKHFLIYYLIIYCCFYCNSSRVTGLCFLCPYMYKLFMVALLFFLQEHMQSSFWLLLILILHYVNYNAVFINII